MELNGYQGEALEKFNRWHGILEEQRVKSEELTEILRKAGHEVPDVGNYPKETWEEMIEKKEIANAPYIDRQDGNKRPIPHVCFKVPTGGGKTLLSAAILENLKMKTGLVLWIVPLNSIFDQTKKALAKRNHHIRKRLERGSGGRVKFLKKGTQFSKNDIRNNLCVMLIKLASINRKKKKEFLLVNGDSGLYRSLFPDYDDMDGNAELVEKFPDLEIDEESKMVKHSLANVIRMTRPVVILDEAHKAYGKHDKTGYAGMINSLDPSMVLEMSATPNPGISNLLVDVPGNDLRREEMIKMQINVNIQTDRKWKHLLSAVHENREWLENEANTHHIQTNDYIRPIVLVRVERTGSDQRDKGYIHAEDAKKYLIEKLGVREEHIAIQSSNDQKDLKDVDLMSKTSQIRWIITKSALMEGWDCPFAYSLAILDNLTSSTAVTQLLGRVLRQPYAHHTKNKALDQCYVYCHSVRTADVVKYVKQGLSEIGMGDIVLNANMGTSTEQTKIVEKRPKTNSPVSLPLVLHKDGKKWLELEYERHILSKVDFTTIKAPDPSKFNPDSQGWKTFGISTAGDNVTSPDFEAHGPQTFNISDFALPLSDIVPNVWQAARIAGEFIEKIHKSGKSESEIYNGTAYLTRVLCDNVAESVNKQAETAFRDKIKKKEIRFDLSITDGNYKVRKYNVEVGKRLQDANGEPVQRTLFDPVFEEEFENDLELSFAEYLDAQQTIQWWHRIASKQNDGYRLRGWKKNYIYPDFITMINKPGDKIYLGIYDTKGNHLENPDSEYKSDVFKTLEKAFNCGTVTVNGSRIRGKFQLVWKDRFEEALP